VQCESVECEAVLCEAVQCEAVLCETVQYEGVQCEAVQCEAPPTAEDKSKWSYISASACDFMVCKRTALPLPLPINDGRHRVAYRNGS